MKIWKIWSSEKNITLTLEKDCDLEVLNNIDGHSLVDNWTPIKVLIEGSKKKKKDFPSFLLKAPVISGKTKKVLEPFLKNHVEFLPLIGEEEHFYLCNVVKVIDDIDENKSISMYAKSGKFIKYEKIVFNNSILDQEQELTIFKINKISGKACFATDKFKKLIEQFKLSGPDFELIWDSELDQDEELNKNIKYEEIIEKINRDPELVLNWEEAIEKLKEGNAAISDQWQIKYDQNETIILGMLNSDLTYDFIIPMYIPPILLDLKWKQINI